MIEDEIVEKSRQLDISIKQLRKTGSDYASAYSSYRIAVAKELAVLRDSGVPVTIASDLARGKPDIAELKKLEIETEAIYLANREAINVLKLQIKLLDNQLSREWGSSGKGDL